MEGETPEETYAASEESHLEFVSSPGYVGDVRKVFTPRGPPCQLCHRVFAGLEKLVEHITKHHKCFLRSHPRVDIARDQKPRKFWCVLCQKIITTTAVGGGRVVHIEKVHGIEEEAFDQYTKRGEQIVLERMDGDWCVIVE